MQKHVIKFIIMLYFIEYFPILALTIHVTVAVIVIGRNGCAFAVITSRHGSRFRRQRRPHGGPLQLRSHQRPLMNASTLLSTIFLFKFIELKHERKSAPMQIAGAYTDSFISLTSECSTQVSSMDQ